MCSLNWHPFSDHLGIAFNRDESVKRSKALPPSHYQHDGINYLMPKDPDGQGSWIAANDRGFVVMLLNDYQGQLKPKEAQLISRGQLVKGVVECATWQQVEALVDAWPLKNSQPFQLAVITKTKHLFWHYDGLKQSIEATELPKGVYSSGHPDVAQIIAARVAYIQNATIERDEDLIAIHRSHKPENDKPIDAEDKLAHAFCMHRPEAKTQSLSYLRLFEDRVEFEYWPGQPCETNQTISKTLALVGANAI